MALVPTYVKNTFSADNMQCFGDLTTDTLEANTMTIDDLNVTTLNATTVNATTGNITTVTSTTVNGSNINGGAGLITNLTSTNITATDITTTQLTYTGSNVSQQAVTTRITAGTIQGDLKNFPVVLNTPVLGANQVALPVYVLISYNYGTTIFTNLSNKSYAIVALGGVEGTVVSGPFGTPMVATNILNSNASVFVSLANIQTFPSTTGLASATYEGAPLGFKQVGSANDSPASGDGSLDIIMVFNIITLPG